VLLTGDVDLSVTEGAPLNPGSKPATRPAGYGLPRSSLRPCLVGAGRRNACRILARVHHVTYGVTCTYTCGSWISLPASFVLAGIDVEDCGFFTGPRGRQLARRFTPIAAAPCNISTVEDREDWTRLIDGFERALLLHRHQPGTLTGLADYLFGRTHGYITSLSHLIRKAALHVIDAGSERIDRRLLDGIPLDHAATRESQDAAAASTRRAKRTTRRSQPKAAQTAA